jgi:predicted CDP-diglyceride synthetase/phosphatidate cytidylyltransferase
MHRSSLQQGIMTILLSMLSFVFLPKNMVSVSDVVEILRSLGRLEASLMHSCFVLLRIPYFAMLQGANDDESRH